MVWINGHFDGEKYVKGHFAKGTISEVADICLSTGKPPIEEKPAEEQTTLADKLGLTPGEASLMKGKELGREPTMSQHLKDLKDQVDRLMKQLGATA